MSHIQHETDIDPLFKSLQFLKIGDMYFNLYRDKLPSNTNGYKLILLSGHSPYELRH